MVCWGPTSPNQSIDSENVVLIVHTKTNLPVDQASSVLPASALSATRVCSATRVFFQSIEHKQ